VLAAQAIEPSENGTQEKDFIKNILADYC